jgi:glycosyltransferase involved in cell wall biosynthesis/ADP-heptose:LPS heptosyltransferase
LTDQTPQQAAALPEVPGGPRLLSVASWDEVQALAERWLAGGAARQAFRLALAHRLQTMEPEPAAFLRERFRDTPFRFAVAMVQGIGNMIMLTPAIRALKSVYPTARLEVVGHRPALDVVAGWELVDEATELADFEAGAERDALLLSMWSGQFSKAYSGLVSSGDVPVVEIEFVDFKRHESEFHMDLARVLGYVGEKPETYCLVREVPLPFEPGDRVALLADTSNPDAEWQRKRWPHFPELARRLMRRGWRVALIGGPDEAERFNPADWPEGVLDLQGKYSVAETAHVIREAGVLIANDSGPAHMAAAVGAELHVLFGPTLVAKNLPAGPGVHVIRSELGCCPCQYLPSWNDCTVNRCMELLSVEQVLGRVLGEHEDEQEQARPPKRRGLAAAKRRREHEQGQGQERVCVDLGCGRFKRRGHIGLDVDPECAADVVCDVTRGIPLATNSVDLLAADNLLEHIGEGFIELMNEMWRVCKPAGRIEITVPLFPADKAVADPTHRRYFTEGTVAYFNSGGTIWRTFGSRYGIRPFHVLSRHKLAGELEVVLRPDKEARPARPARPSRPSRRARVCFVSHNQPGAGGAENAIHQVANRLADNGWQVSVLHNAAPFIHSRPVAEPPDARYRIRWVEGPDLREFHRATSRALEQLAAETDVCLPLWRAASPSLLAACHGHGIPVGVWCQNVQYPPERSNNSVFRAADFVVAVTPYARGVLRRRFSRTDSIFVIPNAAGDEFFDRYREREAGQLRRLIFFGRLADEQKGLATLCNALPAVRDHCPEFTFDVVGDGPDADVVRSKIGSLGLGEHVRLLGWRSCDELAALLADRDLCVLPSNFEGCSLAVIEAMAVGIPLVTTGVGGTPWLITKNKHGLLIEPQKPQELARAVIWALEHPREMNLMGRWAHKKALKRYHWDRVADDYAALFDRIQAARAEAAAARRAG